MSGQGSFARSFSPGNRFSAHRGAGYRLTPGFEITPPEPLLRYESGPWSFFGGASVSAFYSDNVFLEEDDTESEIIRMGRPRVGFRWNQPNYSVGLAYSGTFRDSKFDNMRLDNHQVDFTTHFTIRRSLRGSFRSQWGWRQVLPVSEDAEAYRFSDNTAVLDLYYEPWEDWELACSLDRYDADVNVLEDDVTVHGISITPHRRVAPALWALGHFRWEETNNTDINPVGEPINPDNYTYYASLGARFDPLTPLVGQFHAGITKKVFEGDVINDEETLFLDGRLSYAPRDWMRLYWTISQRLHETSVVAANVPDGAVYERFSTSGGFTIDVAERWGVGAKAFYIQDDYHGPTDREDALYGGRVSGNYTINSWLSLVLSYQYQRNDSNVDGAGFTENFFSGGVDVSF